MKEQVNYVKKIYNAIKTWVIENGITGLGGLVAGIVLFTFGYKFYSGIAFGVFATRNWDILVNYVKSLFNKEKDSSEQKAKK